MADNVLKAKIIADTAGFTKNVEAASGSIDELRVLSKSLKAEIAGLDASLRNSKGGTALKNELRAVTTELKTLEKQAGIAGQQTTGAFNKSFGAVRQLANILPGIGIAGLFGLAFEGIEKLISSLGRLGGALDPVKELRNVMQEAEKSFVKAYTEVNTLKEQVDLAKNGFIDKDSVVKEYNETLGKTIGIAKNLEDVERLLTQGGEAYIRMTLLKAAANIALEKAAQKAFDAEEARQKSIQEFNTFGSRANVGTVGQSSAPGFVPGQSSFLEGAAARQAAAKKAQQDAVNDAKKNEKVFTDIADNLLKQAGEISKSFNFDFNGNNKIEKAKTLEQTMKETVALAKELASFLDGRTIRSVQFTVDPRDSLQKQFKDAQEFLKRTENLTSEFAYKINVFPQINFEKDRPDLFKDLPKETEDLQKKLQKEIDALTKRNPILIESAKLGFDRRRLEEAALRLAQELDSAIRNAFQGAFTGIAEALGDALSGKDIGGNIFSIIGDLIAQIGKALVQYGIVKAGLDKVLKAGFALPGAVAIAIGAAAIAASQLVKNLKPMGARASGGAVNAGQGYYVGEKGTELFVPNTAGRIVPNNVLAGNTGRVQREPLEIYGEFRQRGNDLVAVIAAANRSGRRLN